MKSKKAILVVVLVVLIAVGGKWIASYLNRKEFGSGFNTGKELTPVEKTAENDRGILNKKDASDYEVMGALIRLAAIQDPSVRARLLESVKSSSKIVRAAAGEGLGYYDDESSLAIVENLLSDPEEMVRIRALKGLAHRRSPTREKILQRRLKSSGLSPAETMEIHTALVSAGTTPEVRTEALKYLIELARKHQAGVSYSAAVAAMGLAPVDPLTIHFAKFEVESGTESNTVADAIRHLAGFDASWIRDRLSGLRTNPSVNVRLAIVQSLHAACPGDRWAILKSMIQVEKNTQVQEAILQETMDMAGPNAISFLAWTNDTFKEKAPALAEKAQAYLVRIKGSKSSDACAGPSP